MVSKISELSRGSTNGNVNDVNDTSVNLEVDNFIAQSFNSNDCTLSALCCESESLINDISAKLFRLKSNYAVLLSKLKNLEEESKKMEQRIREMQKKYIADEESPVQRSLKIGNFNGLDYGSGMAYSFFYGYLNLMLPPTGGADKSFEEFVKDYEAAEKVKFAVRKLFILLPMSCHCPPSLQDSSSPSIEESKTLHYKEIDVSGVKKRNYKNSVYKITDSQKKKIYVSAEYATPLKTFREVIMHNTPHSKVYEKHRNDIVLQFYFTLRRILKDNPECRKVCELIYYNDMDAYGGYKDVGEIILQRIQEIKVRSKRKTD